MSGLRRYIRLLGLMTKIGLMQQMAYRPHFFFMISGKIIRMGLLFFFFQAVFFKVNRIGQWTFDQVLLLFATFHVVDYLMSITFQRNLASYLPRLIQTGEFDSRMTMPANLLFLISFEKIDTIDFFSALPAFGFLIFVLQWFDFAFNWLQVILYVLLLMNALVFLYAVFLMMATISFWTVQAYGLARIFDNLSRIGRYPLDIFEGFWKLFLIYFLPLVLIAQVPSQALLNTLSWSFIFYAFGVTGVFLAAALQFWKFGVRNYTSTGT